MWAKMAGIITGLKTWMNELVEHLRHIDGTAVEPNCRKVQNAPENELRRKIVEDIDDCYAA